MINWKYRTNDVSWMPKKCSRNHVMMYRKRNGKIVSEPQYMGIYYYDEDGIWRDENRVPRFLALNSKDAVWTFELFAWCEVEEVENEDIYRVWEKFREEFGVY